MLLKQWFCIQCWIWTPIYRQFPFENNFSQMINCPLTRANMNAPIVHREPTGIIIVLQHTLCNNAQVLIRTSYCYHWCHIAMQSVSQIESKWKFQWHKPEQLHSVSVSRKCDEPKWCCWPGVTPGVCVHVFFLELGKPPCDATS